MKSSHCQVVVLYNLTEATRRPGDELSSEYATVLAANQAAKALVASGFHVALTPVRNCLPELVGRLQRQRPDVVVNLCEGFRGCPAFEAQVTGLLELMGLAFTGNPSSALALCQDKFRAKAVLSAWSLPTPRSWLAEAEEDIPRAMKFPLIVKPNAEDASIGIGRHSVVRDRKSLRRQVARLVQRYQAPALIEDYVNGREFNVAVLEDTALRALPVSEIIFRNLPVATPRIVGYEAKWNETSAWYRQTVPVCPAPVPARLAGWLRRLALEACAALRIQGYARVDFRVDRQGRPFILEVNPNPDPSREAGLARALAAAGIAYESFWEQQARLAMKRPVPRARVAQHEWATCRSMLRRRGPRLTNGQRPRQQCNRKGKL